MPKNKTTFKYKVWKVVASTPFEYFILLLIVLNTVLLMMKVSMHDVCYESPIDPIISFLLLKSIRFFFKNVMRFIR